MNHQAFLDSMEKHLLHFWPKPKKEEEIEYQNWLHAIYNGVRWIDPFRFDQTAQEVSISAPKFRRDLRAQMLIATYYRLADKHGWNKPAATGGDKEDYILALRRMLSGMKPSAARYVLGRVDAGEVKYPDEILNDLVILAGKDSA